MTSLHQTGSGMFPARAGRGALKSDLFVILMKSILTVLLAIASASGLTGCASTGGYFADRGRDFADIFTLTAGVGGGAKAKVGPFATGLSFHMDMLGLRGGKSFAPFEMQYSDMWFPVPLPIEWGWICGLEEFEAPEHEKDPRIKNFEYGSRWPLVISDLFDDEDADKDKWQKPYPYQVELGIGLGISLHTGINPAEFVDFIVGWFGLALFNDDLAR